MTAIRATLLRPTAAAFDSEALVLGGAGGSGSDAGIAVVVRPATAVGWLSLLCLCSVMRGQDGKIMSSRATVNTRLASSATV